MNPTRAPLVLSLLAALHGATARAQVPAAPPGAGERPAEAQSFLDRHLDLEGYLRVRLDVLRNLDLNHGPTPTTGRPIYPTSPSDPSATLVGANMRMRLDPTITVGWGVSLHARIDILDNLVFGSTPEGLPATIWAPMSGGASAMVPPEADENASVDSIRVKRAWGQVVLPIGVLAAGRMGSLIDWGTGFFINSGSCLDCDRGDVGDRVTFTTPLLGHLWGLAFDWGASGPTSETLRADPQPINLDRHDDVRSYALLFARYDLPEVVQRYRRAGRAVWQYGLVASLREQQDDIPAYYLTGDRSRSYDANDLVHRGLLAFAADLWIGLRYRGFTVDLEGAMVISSNDNASLLPGTEFVPEVTARQFGGVLRASHAWSRVELGLEFGAASGDQAPGFGVASPLDQLTAQAGDLDGPQLRIPGDTSINNFRFNPDYHVDQILWRRIIGTVTDAAYVRPKLRASPLPGLWLESVLITSLALEASSTPSGERPLGVELNLGAGYRLEPGFEAQLTYAVLFPLSGLRNTRLDLDPEPAHHVHLILAFCL